MIVMFVRTASVSTLLTLVFVMELVHSLFMNSMFWPYRNSLLTNSIATLRLALHECPSCSKYLNFVHAIFVCEDVYTLHVRFHCTSKAGRRSANYRRKRETCTRKQQIQGEDTAVFTAGTLASVRRLPSSWSIQEETPAPGVRFLAHASAPEEGFDALIFLEHSTSCIINSCFLVKNSSLPEYFT